MTAPRIGWIPSSRDPRVASARLRCALPSRYLREAGWRSELFDEGRADEYDLVVFQKAYGERELALQQSLRRRGATTVFDLCDNHFYNPDGLPALAARADRLTRMVDAVDAVSVATPPLADLVAEREAVVIDDALDEIEPVREGRRRLRFRRRAEDALRLVWFGNAGLESPPFGLVHLPKIFPALAEVHAETPLRLTVISNSRAAYETVVKDVPVPTDYREWGLASFAEVFPQHEICVIPIEQNPFSICKTSNRVALSLRLGVPVVADRIPSFDEFSDFILLGNWVESLRRYASDPELRGRHVTEGRRYVEAKYTKERIVSQWSSLIERVLSGRGATATRPL